MKKGMNKEFMTKGMNKDNLIYKSSNRFNKNYNKVY